MSMAAGKPKAKAKAATKTVEQPKIEANPNRDLGGVEARSVDEALKLLEENVKDDEKWNYKKFEDEMLPQIRDENKGLKLSAAKDKCWKLWERSPLNPKNAEK